MDIVNAINKTLMKIMAGKNVNVGKLQGYSMRFGIELRKVTRMERVRATELHVMFFNGHQFEVHVIKGNPALLNDVAGALAQNAAVDMNKAGLYL